MGNRNLERSCILFFLICILNYAIASCPSLSLLPGTLLTCELPKENRTVDCLNGTENIPKGTVGKYRCERDMDFNDTILKCGCKGRWRGILVFNDFMSNCNISDYSNNGPAELNLTEVEIDKLALPVLEQPNTKDFQEDGVAYHNLYRAIHHSPPLELNQTLSDAAQNWADHLIDERVLKTQPWSDRRYAQTLYSVYGQDIDARKAVKLAVAAWYQGVYRYDGENPSGPSAFTQLVWASTTDLGIGITQRENRTVVVANYYPPGNVIVSNKNGDDKWAWFRINVLPPNSVDDIKQTQNATVSTTTFSSSTSTVASTTTTAKMEASSAVTTTTEMIL